MLGLIVCFFGIHVWRAVVSNEFIETYVCDRCDGHLYIMEKMT